MTHQSICDSCCNASCIFQSGIYRESCSFYIDKDSFEDVLFYVLKQRYEERHSDTEKDVSQCRVKRN